MIGMETADEEALQFMNKGYRQNDILVQCRRLDKAGISYKFFYLVGISGKGRGAEGAKVTAEVCNQLHPKLVGANMLTIYPDSELYQEIRKGNWLSDGKLMETQTANYFSDIYPIDCAVLSANAQSCPKCCTLLPVLLSA